MDRFKLHLSRKLSNYFNMIKELKKMKNLFLITIIFLLSCNMAYAKRYINLADSLITDKDNVYEVSKLDNVVCNPLNKCKTDFYIVVYMKNEDKQKSLKLL